MKLMFPNILAGLCNFEAAASRMIEIINIFKFRTRFTLLKIADLYKLIYFSCLFGL